MYQVLVNAITSNFDIKHKTYKPFPINIEKKKMDVDPVMGIDTVYTMHRARFQPIKLLKSIWLPVRLEKKNLRKCSPFKVIFWTQQHEKFAKQNATTDDLKMVTSSKESAVQYNSVVYLIKSMALTCTRYTCYYNFM